MDEFLDTDDESDVIQYCNYLILNMVISNQKSINLFENIPEVNGLKPKLSDISNRFKVLTNINPWEKKGNGNFVCKIFNPKSGKEEPLSIEVSFSEIKLCITI